MSMTMKLKVDSVQDGPAGQGKSLTLFADYMDERNKAWSPYTPSATLTATVTDEVAGYFTSGRNFLVTFEPED